MLNCIAIDDEPLALVILEQFCSRVPGINLARTFTDTFEAEKYLRKFPVDLLFLDIQMPDRNGMDFYRAHGSERMVIFTTAFSNYAVEGFNLSAVDYLLKPIEFGRFEQAVAKANDYHAYLNSSPRNTANLYLRSEYSLVKISCNEIRYIETLDDYVKIYLDGKKPVLSKINLKNLMSKLDPSEFVRIHRSYIAPLRRIRSVRGRTAQLDDISLPIGAKYEEEFLKKFSSL
jgi:DNA-binding LytR/AlgR family response regulator